MLAVSPACSPGFTLGILQVRAQQREGKSYSMKSFCLASGELYLYHVCVCRYICIYTVYIYCDVDVILLRLFLHVLFSATDYA